MRLMSSTNITKSRWPNTEPCGTPLMTVIQLDRILFSTTHPAVFLQEPHKQFVCDPIDSSLCNFDWAADFDLVMIIVPSM